MELHLCFCVSFFCIARVGSGVFGHLYPFPSKVGTLSVQSVILLGLDSLSETDLPGGHRLDSKVDPPTEGVLLDQFRLLGMGLDSVSGR